MPLEGINPRDEHRCGGVPLPEEAEETGGRGLVVPARGESADGLELYAAGLSPLEPDARDSPHLVRIRSRGQLKRLQADTTGRPLVRERLSQHIGCSYIVDLGLEALKALDPNGRGRRALKQPFDARLDLGLEQMAP